VPPPQGNLLRNVVRVSKVDRRQGIFESGSKLVIRAYQFVSSPLYPPHAYKISRAFQPPM
jgi:hypothetical protein